MMDDYHLLVGLKEQKVVSPKKTTERVLIRSSLRR